MSFTFLVFLLSLSVKKMNKEENPTLASLGAHATKLYMFSKDYDLAEACFEKLYQEAHRKKEFDDVFRIYTCEYASFLTVIRKDSEKAILLYEDVLQTDPRHCMALGNLAMLKHQIGRYEEADMLYKKSIAIYPNHTSILASFANLIKVWKKDYIQSKHIFEKAISISNAEDTELLGNYAVLLHGHLRDYDAAEKAYRRSIEAPGGTYCSSGMEYQRYSLCFNQISNYGGF